MGSTYSFASTYDLLDATPLAQLMSEPEGILVPGGLAVRDRRGVRRGLEGRPEHRIRDRRRRVAGQDRPPLSDATGGRGRHRPQRRELRVVRRRRAAHQRLLGAKIDAGLLGARPSRGLQSGRAICGCSPCPGRNAPGGSPFADAPTLTAEGMDLVFLNWRGVLAPPKICEERARRADRLLRGDARHRRSGRRWLADNGWTDDFKAGEDFGTSSRSRTTGWSGTLEELELM